MTAERALRIHGNSWHYEIFVRGADAAVLEVVTRRRPNLPRISASADLIPINVLGRLECLHTCNPPLLSISKENMHMRKKPSNQTQTPHNPEGTPRELLTSTAVSASQILTTLSRAPLATSFPSGEIAIEETFSE